MNPGQLVELVAQTSVERLDGLNSVELAAGNAQQVRGKLCLGHVTAGKAFGLMRKAQAPFDDRVPLEDGQRHARGEVADGGPKVRVILESKLHGQLRLGAPDHFADESTLEDRQIEDFPRTGAVQKLLGLLAAQRAHRD